MDDPAAVRALLAPTSNGRTLITARQALEWVPAGQHVRLGPLPSPASLSVLVNRLPTGNDAEQRLTILREDPCELISARRVAEQLGHHPLSLAVAAALIGRDEALTFHAPGSAAGNDTLIWPLVGRE